MPTIVCHKVATGSEATEGPNTVGAPAEGRLRSVLRRLANSSYSSPIVKACMRVTNSSFSFLKWSSSFAVTTPCRPTSVKADGVLPASVMVQSSPPAVEAAAAGALGFAGPPDEPEPAAGVTFSTMKTPLTELLLSGSVSWPLIPFKHSSWLRVALNFACLGRGSPTRLEA